MPEQIDPFAAGVGRFIDERRLIGRGAGVVTAVSGGADSLALLATMAADAEAQVWIERVGEGAECSVIIEDGSIKADEKEEA